MAGGASNDDDGMIAGINVTPLVDVTLVLLIIFMVTAKMIVSQGMPMDLPKAASGQDIQTVFSVELSADGKTMVDSKEVPDDEAVSGLAKSAKAKNKDIRAVIRADKKVEHGRVIHVLDLLNRAGISKVAFGVQQAAPGETTAKPASSDG
ncbi:MAG: biopolymer transporter ExbD [Polyangiaceae bacterium]|nr:biopolymer transporter ExbD [Polyangiaceae bacterium]MCB9605450.1 biopolymer transporter ExbD [Polyangiaceae bacterium]